MTSLGFAPAGQPLALERVQLSEQVEPVHEIGLEPCDDFFTCSVLADLERVVPDAPGRFRRLLRRPM